MSKHYNISIFLGFPKFLYDSHAWFGEINCMEELYEMLKIHEICGWNKSYTLNQSRTTKDNSLNFGTRSEHIGDLTLRIFLKTYGVEFKIF